MKMMKCGCGKEVEADGNYYMAVCDECAVDEERRTELAKKWLRRVFGETSEYFSAGHNESCSGLFWWSGFSCEAEGSLSALGKLIEAVQEEEEP